MFSTVVVVADFFFCLFSFFSFFVFPSEKKYVNIIIRVWRGFSRPLAKFIAFLEALFSAGALSHASRRSVMEENDDGQFSTSLSVTLVSFLASRSLQLQFV